MFLSKASEIKKLLKRFYRHSRPKNVPSPESKWMIVVVLLDQSFPFPGAPPPSFHISHALNVLLCVENQEQKPHKLECRHTRKHFMRLMRLGAFHFDGAE
ncbi:hypothetical protein ACMFMF_004041 [Clarireedia jacksonii]